MIGGAIVKGFGFAVFVVAWGLISGLLALYSYVSAGWVILTALGVVVALAVTIVGAIYLTGRRHRDVFGDLDTAIEAHMGPLRQPGDAERTLAIDLRQKRMLLRGQRQPGRHAAQPAPPPVIPAATGARTETIPVVPPEPTEVIPVVPGTAYPDWPTGEFAACVDRTGGES